MFCTLSFIFIIIRYLLIDKFWIFLNRIKFGFYLHCFDWFCTKQNSVCCKINMKSETTIQIWFDIRRFMNDFSECESKDFWLKSWNICSLLGKTKLFVVPFILHVIVVTVFLLIFDQVDQVLDFSFLFD